MTGFHGPGPYAKAASTTAPQTHLPTLNYPAKDHAPKITGPQHSPAHPNHQPPQKHTFTRSSA